VFFDTSATGLTADQLAARVRREGVLMSTVGEYRVRACTHLDVDAGGVALALQTVAEAVRSGAGASA
jgi:threonine aldolase